MGEYAIRKSDKKEVKIGTCECMYYLTYEDKNEVKAIPGNVDPGTTFDLFWRLPFPDEDHIHPGEYEEYNRGLRLFRYDDKGRLEDFSDPETVNDPGNIQLHHRESGCHVNMTCYHGAKLPEATNEFKPFWNGKGHSFELAFIKNTRAGIVPVVRCRYCEQMWRYTWEEILPFIADQKMRNRLEKYHLQSKYRLGFDSGDPAGDRHVEQ